MFKVQ
jgi:phosphoglycerate kinase